MAWPSFIRFLVGSFAAMCAVIYAAILLIDPYDQLSFSLPLEREPISTNQRFAYPSLARNLEFDSAIIGSSTARLLKPERLDELTGQRFVNLAMNSATAYEQMQILDLFLRHHPDAKIVVIGIDDAWCRQGDEIQKFTFRAFPPWMYDENPYNDLLYLFNDKALENAVRMVEYWTGKREAKYDRTGYRDFTEDFGEYDPEVVFARLYPGEKPHSLPEDRLDAVGDVTQTYASHALLRRFLQSTPDGLGIVVVHMPLHANYLRRGRQNYAACKRRIADITAGLREIRVLDFMQVSDLTRDDENFWDPLHYRTPVALHLERELAVALHPSARADAAGD